MVVWYFAPPVDRAETHQLLLCPALVCRLLVGSPSLLKIPQFSVEMRDSSYDLVEYAVRWTAKPILGGVVSSDIV